MHASMTLNACCGVNGREIVSGVINPKVKPDQVPEFLMRHLELNVAQIAHQTKLNADDTLALLHFITAVIGEKNPQGINFQDVALNDKKVSAIDARCG